MNNVPFKYIIDYKDEDCMHFLFQLLRYIDKCAGNMEFNLSEANIYSTVRKNGKVQPLINELIEKQYIVKEKHSKYKIIKNPWE